MYLPETDREQTPELLGHSAPNPTQSFKMLFLVPVEALMHTGATPLGPCLPPPGLRLTRTWAALKR